MMKKEPEFTQFFAEGAERRRYYYPSLTDTSIVMDIGAYCGSFATRITDKYGCRVIGYEPVPTFYDKLIPTDKITYKMYGIGDATEHKNVILSNDASSSNLNNANNCTTVECKFVDILDEIDNIDGDIELLKINIEGDEFPLLKRLVHSPDHIKRVKNIQVQFHNFVDDCENKRNYIVNLLSETHDQTWCYYFVWENWKLK